MLSELIGVYREHNFVDELNSQISEVNVAELPVLDFAVDGLSLWKENRNGLPGSRLRIG